MQTVFDEIRPLSHGVNRPEILDSEFSGHGASLAPRCTNVNRLYAIVRD